MFLEYFFKILDELRVATCEIHIQMLPNCYWLKYGFEQLHGI